MFDPLPHMGIPDPATVGERLAWICLLCYVRAVGRNQHKFDAITFANAYRLNVDDVNGILNRGGLYGTYRLNSGRIVIVDWKSWGSGNRRRDTIPKSIRAAVLMRDGNKCRYCGEPAETLDHLMPYSRGGSKEPSNLVACCRICNSRKHAKTPEEAGMLLTDA